MSTPRCRGENTEIFYDNKRWAEAAQMCRECPLTVKLQCRQDFGEDPWAYAGGMTPGQRNAWFRRESERGRQPRTVTPAPRSRRAKLTEAEIKNILYIFDTEMVGTKTIADRVGLAKSTVQRCLRQHGRARTEEQNLELARAGGLSGGNKVKAEANAEMIMNLFAAGNSPKEVAELAGMTLSHIYLTRRKRVMELLALNYGADVVGKMVNMTEDQVLKMYRRFK